MSPVVTTEELCVIEAPVVAVSELKGVVPPIAPDKVTLPSVPPVRVNDLEPLPLIVLEKEMAAPAAVPPAFVGSMAMLAVSVAGPVIETEPPLVIKLPPKLIAVDPV